MENHHFKWVNPLFQWQFSIAMLVYQRVITFGLALYYPLLLWAFRRIKSQWIWDVLWDVNRTSKPRCLNKIQSTHGTHGTASCRRSCHIGWSNGCNASLVFGMGLATIAGHGPSLLNSAEHSMNDVFHIFAHLSSACKANVILQLCYTWTDVGLSENSVPLHPMVLLIIIPMKNGYFIGNIPNIFRQTQM